MPREDTNMPNLKIVGIGGSLDGSSSSLAALKIAMNAASEAGAQTTVLDLRELKLPVYEPGLEATPSVQTLIKAVEAADGLLWSSPLYHGTISGAFKNAMDWLEILAKRSPPYLTDKVVGLIATAGGAQGLQAINTMEFIVRSLRGWTIPLVVPVASAWQAFDANGKAVDPAVGSLLRALGVEVVRAAGVFAVGGATTPEAQAAEAALNPVFDGQK
jgi:FMN reductase